MSCVVVLFNLYESIINQFCSQLQLAFQVCPVASPLRGSPIRHEISIHHHSILPLPPRFFSVLSHLSQMDSSLRNRMPASSNVQNSRQRAPETAPTSSTSSIGEIDGRVDQLALVQQTLHNGATLTMIAGFPMIMGQMESQAAQTDVLLTITSSIGSLERSASFRDGTWHGYNVTHDLIDPRSHMVHKEPNRPPMDQERSLRVSPATMQLQTHVPLPPLEPTRFTCALPVVPPPLLTPPCLWHQRVSDYSRSRH